MENKIPRLHLTCDTPRGDGNIYLFDEYFEWFNRDTGDGFRIRYDVIKDIRVIRTSKNQVLIFTKGGKEIVLLLYKTDELLSALYERINALNGDNAPLDNDMLSQLERLAKLHESGALTDEEFAKAKERLLK